ncbi:MAG: hypothetical protein FWE70_01645 [Oscillospiraceae bacterium]|nr:hypothetical protein [Oscillospiraceae bacterium]
MKVSDKLELFRMMAVKEAGEKRDSILLEMDAEHDRFVAGIVSAGRAKAEKALGEARAKARQEMNVRMLKAEGEARMALVRARGEMEGELFSIVTARLMEYVGTKPYMDSLAASMMEAAAEFPDMAFRVCARDRARMGADWPTGLLGRVTPDEGDGMIGGYVGVTADGGLTLDNALSSRLGEARSGFSGFGLGEAR